MIQHFVPDAAPLITGFAGVPHAQSEPPPPGVQEPFVASKSSLYGNVVIGVVHCATDLCVKQNVLASKKRVPAVLFKSDRNFIN